MFLAWFEFTIIFSAFLSYISFFFLGIDIDIDMQITSLSSQTEKIISLGFFSGFNGFVVVIILLQAVTGLVRVWLILDCVFSLILVQ